MHSSLPQQLENFNFTTSRFLIGLFTLLEDRAVNLSDAVITICPDIYDYARKRIHDPSRVILIENSIFEPIQYRNADGEIGMPDETKLPECLNRQDKKIVTYAGTLETYQGIDVLIHAFKRVAALVPDADLMIVGGTPDQVEKYRQLSKSCGIDDRVVLTGQVTPEKARRLNKASNLLVSPRIKGTNTPLKVYEQIASNIPIVATNIHSHTQVLDENVAILVDPNPDALSQGIVRGLQHPESRRVAVNAKRLYNDKYSRPIYVKKLDRAIGMVS
jgi:glycosyltransferase involved in cell wall biosynthesis